MKRLLVLALLLGIVAFATVVNAQTLTGTIAGKVTDEQGGVLPGVTVTLTGKTGSQTQVTDAKGEFRFIGLSPGVYSVKSELSGFRPKEQQNLDVTIGKTIEVPIAMAVGGLTETVDVVANAITIDTTSTKTDTNMSQDLLFTMPLTHNNPAVNILQYAPGVNDGSAFGGASDGANSLMLDGVDTRDPEGGTAWTFYNFDIIQEVQVGALGQPAELGGFTGAVVNTITKSGGNRFSFLGTWRFSNDSLGSSNLASVESRQAQCPVYDSGTYTTLACPVNAVSPTLYPATVNKYSDYTVQLGGPIQKDKLFFFGSIQRYNIEQHISNPLRTEVSPRFNFKLTYQPTASDTITGAIQYDQYNQTGRTAWIPGYAVTNNNQTVNQDSPEIIYNAQYRKVFNSSTFLEAKFMGWWGYYYLNPVIPDPAHYDGMTNKYSGGAGYNYLADRTRNQVNASVSKFAEKAGSHNFKFGMEIERSTIRDRFQYSGASANVPGGVAFYDYGGPSSAYGYKYDLNGKTSRESFYGQDQWKIGNRLTLNLGVRLDHIGGSDKATGTQLYSTTSVGPRLGAAYDLSGKGTSVVRGFYGQMYEGAVFSSWSRATSGLSPTYYYTVNGDWSLEPWYTSERTYSTLKDKISHPRVDEFNVAFEQQIARTYKFTATYIHRNWENFINSWLPNDVWSTTTYTPASWRTDLYGPVPGNFQPTPLTLYKLPDLVESPAFTIQNTKDMVYRMADGSTIAPNGYRHYRGLMLLFQRAYKNRWQAQISYVLSKTTGTINNGTYDGMSSGQFETPNTILVNADGPTGYDRRHEVKIFAAYQIPKVEVNVSGAWRFLSGQPYVPYVRVSADDELNVGWESYIYTNMIAPGVNSAFVTPNDTNLDLRFEKVFNYGIHRFGIYADLQNAFNQTIITGVQTRWPYRTLSYHDPTSPDPTSVTDVRVPFGSALYTNAGRQVTFGVRWSF
ncbi:MAG: TonB-dependent receptor [Bacteroidales bacterium]